MNNDFIDNIYNIINDSNNKDLTNLYNNMSTYQKNIVSTLLNDKEKFINYSLNDLIFDFDSEIVQKILELEINTYLEFCKNNNIDNKRNGYTKDINLTISDRNVSFNRPRLRNEKDFNSIFIPKRTRIIKDLADNIIYLYSLNNSVNDIKKILKQFYNLDLSSCYISETVNTIANEICEWRNRQLDKCYFTINIDCTYISIRDNKNIASHKLPVYVAIGTKLNGKKEIVGMYLGNEDANKNIIDELSDKDIGESKNFWLEVLSDLKDRGVEEILYLVSDGINGIKDAIKEEFPNCFYQRCIVHLCRNLEKYTTKNDKSKIIKDFKNIYTSANKELAIVNYEYFKNEYKNKKTMLRHAEEYISYIMPLFDIPENIRNYIYTNNISESANSKIKRGFYGRGALPNATSAINIIYFNLKSLEEKWSKQKVKNWDKIFNELSIVHKTTLEKYLMDNK